MGHADIDTTMRYLHFVPRACDADLIAQAFSPPQADDPTPAPEGAICPANTDRDPNSTSAASPTLPRVAAPSTSSSLTSAPAIAAESALRAARKADSMRVAATAGLSCSQTRMTCQPACWSAPSF